MKRCVAFFWGGGCGRLGLGFYSGDIGRYEGYIGLHRVRV